MGTTPITQKKHILDTQPRYLYRVLWASIIGFALDGFDMLLLSFAMPALIVAFGLTLAKGGMVATITLIGAVVGGYIFGILADYYGRVRVFSLTIIIFSIFTGFTALSSSYAELNLFRFITGLGLGGEFGIGMTFIAMFVVFTALAVLYIIYKNLGRFFIKRATKVEVKTASDGITEKVVKEVEMSGEINAAIAMALYLYQSDLHDHENTVLTIQKVSRTYSPWSSKIYTLRKLPR